MSKLLEFYEITCDGAEEKATIEEIKELMEVGAADFESLKDKEMMLAEKIKSTFLLLDKVISIFSQTKFKQVSSVCATKIQKKSCNIFFKIQYHFILCFIVTDNFKYLY